MIGYRDTAEALAALGNEVLDHVEGGSGSDRARRVLERAADLTLQAAELVLSLDQGDELGADVRALAVLCAVCGHDRGDHLVEAPHACECELSWFHVGKERERLRLCECPGFVAIAEVASDLMLEERRPA